MDTLVAAAIHDAKNALLALDTQLAALQCRPASADFQRCRASVAQVAGQLAELLVLYRAEGGTLRLAIDDRLIEDFVTDLGAEFGPLPAGKQLAVALALPAAVSAWAFDAYLIRLALLDALRNAARHAATTITLAVAMTTDHALCFSVSDDGPGYPDELLAGAAPQPGVAGTGLGLSFARLIAARHGTPDGRHGRLELSNTPGACLKLILP
jgi:signal transduction histidine kinase